MDIERYFGSHFDLGRLSRVLGFLASAIVGVAASGAAEALGYKLFHTPNEPIWITWQHWFDVVGIVTVAPLIIGLVSAQRVPPTQRELTEGAAALLAIVVTTGIIILKLPATWWDIDVLVVLLLPLLAWAAARCRPVFAAAAVFAVCMMIVLGLTFDFGHFHKAFPSTEELVLNAHIGIVGVALCALILASLFTERRQHEAELAARETGLQEALKAGAVMAFEWDMSTDLSRPSNNAAQILRLDPRQVLTRTSYLARVHPDDCARYKELVGGLNRDNSAYSITYRFTRTDGRELWLEETSNAEFDAAGRLARIKGLALPSPRHPFSPSMTPTSEKSLSVVRCIPCLRDVDRPPPSLFASLGAKRPGTSRRHRSGLRHGALLRRRVGSRSAVTTGGSQTEDAVDSRIG